MSGLGGLMGGGGGGGGSSVGAGLDLGRKRLHTKDKHTYIAEDGTHRPMEDLLYWYGREIPRSRAQEEMLFGGGGLSYDEGFSQNDEAPFAPRVSMGGGVGPSSRRRFSGALPERSGSWPGRPPAMRGPSPMRRTPSYRDEWDEEAEAAGAPMLQIPYRRGEERYGR